MVLLLELEQSNDRIDLSKSKGQLLGARRFSMTFPDKFPVPLDSSAAPSAAAVRTDVTCRTVILRRSRPGTAWGFSISGGSGCGDGLHTTTPKGVVTVTRVTPESPAFQAGLMQEDRLLCVNGKDLSQATHEEAVEAFRNAQEPIIVQVARQKPAWALTATSGSFGTDGLLPLRIPPPPTKPLPPPPAATPRESDSVGALGTERAASGGNSEKQKPHRKLRSLMSAPLPQQQQHQHLQHLERPRFRQPLCLSSSSQDLILGDAIEQLYQLADEESSDFEEVTLHRSSSSQRLGLTLCYNRRLSSEGPAITDVYVGSVEPGSPAADIRPGDRILRVNGQPVLSREQTVRLFAKAGQAVSLLVARSRRQSASVSPTESHCRGSYALYDVAAVESAGALSNSHRLRPSRGQVPRMGTRGLPPPQPQRQPQPPSPQPQKVSAACQTAAVAIEDALTAAASTEWVVKRRPDGSRYVTRRKAKTRLRRAGGHRPSALVAVEDRDGEDFTNGEGDCSGDSAKDSNNGEIDEKRERRRRQRLASFQQAEFQQQQQQQQQLVPVAFV